ncbi:MAG: hypothetical protein GDA48_19420 [Hormoscilla sp. GM102CHS1]|nr:hypothetical protein [Hormoscilla sp. GM102CHS1]
MEDYLFISIRNFPFYLRNFPAFYHTHGLFPQVSSLGVGAASGWLYERYIVSPIAPKAINPITMIMSLYAIGDRVFPEITVGDMVPQNRSVVYSIGRICARSLRVRPKRKSTL